MSAATLTKVAVMEAKTTTTVALLAVEYLFIENIQKRKKAHFARTVTSERSSDRVHSLFTLAGAQQYCCVASMLCHIKI